jgi:hypothetical protein
VEQLELKVIRHGKPAAAYLATLHTPTKKDYDQLVQACLEAIISGENHVRIAFSYLMKYPDDFPRGVLVKKVGANNVHKILARKLLLWLHEHKHTDITVESLKVQRVIFSRFENFIEESLDAE